MPAVLLVIGDASEVIDTMYPFFRLPEDGFEVVVAAPEVRLYHMVQHEQPPGWDITQETPGYHLQSDIAFRDIVADDYAGLFLSGGRAPEYLRYDEHLLAVTRRFMETGRPVASVCHGIEILAAADCLQGRKATSVAKCALDATMAGGEFVNEPVVVDGNLVSARTWHDNTPFLKEFVRMLHESQQSG
ncbi:MAG: DJ-1/PfpI family protein [Planctomycetaceae bacterium]|nr:DJ-1/PfpI family protein [Planctomycetaceae bacterium]